MLTVVTFVTFLVGVAVCEDDQTMALVWMRIDFLYNITSVS